MLVGLMNIKIGRKVPPQKKGAKEKIEEKVEES
jgi:hypothetical protein